MKELIENAQEFIESAKDNLKKGRYNVAVADSFKAISNYSDYLIYKKTKILPKNHNERFDLLKKYFEIIYSRSLELFEVYRNSYNLRLKKEDAEKLERYADELKRIAELEEKA